jgi:hypothetical protein
MKPAYCTHDPSRLRTDVRYAGTTLSWLFYENIEYEHTTHATNEP